MSNVTKTKFSKAEHEFRSLLRELRLSSGLTQLELADRLGQPQSYVSKYEIGERRLDFVETHLVCEALGKDIGSFSAAFLTRLTSGRKKER